MLLEDFHRQLLTQRMLQGKLINSAYETKIKFSHLSELLKWLGMAI